MIDFHNGWYIHLPHVAEITLEDRTVMSAQSTSIAKTLRADTRAGLRARLRHGVGGRMHRGAILRGFAGAHALRRGGSGAHAAPGRGLAGAEGVMA
jgi:hypothetical protein